LFFVGRHEFPPSPNRVRTKEFVTKDGRAWQRATMILDLEERAFRAWPAAEVRELDGWRLRSTGGVTRRANSVWPNRGTGPTSLAGRLDEVEAFYAARRLPALYQITTIATPSGLDDALAARGYLIEAPVAVEVATTDDLRLAASAETRIEEQLRPAWFELSAHRGRFSAVADVYRGLLDRLDGRALYATALQEGTPAAVGLGVIDGDWLGVFSMLTLPDCRRRGLGTALLAALAGAARVRGLAHLYLQVELENEAARSLYHRAGFREAYRYHYRREPSTREGSKDSSPGAHLRWRS
jgi:ribosomal protein S18 acetylase RimI-like enzyme